VINNVINIKELDADKSHQDEAFNKEKQERLIAKNEAEKVIADLQQFNRLGEPVRLATADMGLSHAAQAAIVAADGSGIRLKRVPAAGYGVNEGARAARAARMRMSLEWNPDSC